VDMNDRSLETPLFVIGAPRSGTTILSGLLSADSTLAFIGEPRFTWKFGNEKHSDLLRVQHARPEVIAYIRGAFAEIARQQGRDRILEKTPSNALRMGFVDRVFPDARYIHVIRNGIDSTVSINRYWHDFGSGLPGRLVRRRLKDLDFRRAPYYVKEFVRRATPDVLRPLVGRSIWGPELPGIQQLLREMALEEVCALQWRCCVEAACAYGRKLDPTRYLEIRYEDLSEALLSQVLEFSEIRDPDAVLESFRNTFREDKRRTPEAGEREAVIQKALPILEPTLRWLGYPID
jgi:hypothetical protein